MILCGFYELERIAVHPNDEPNSLHWIDITKDKDEPVFYVTCCCNEDWEWDFDYDKTTYEKIKHVITDCVLECDTMEELLDTLDEIFEDMIYGDDGENEECDGDCDHCSFNEDRYFH